ncbi:MAG: hypothetical protein V2A76_09380 [Planctomycetota bacterium]
MLHHLFLLLLAAAPAQSRPFSRIEPHTVESPSGSVSFEVKPRDGLGRGRAQVRLLHDGEPQFEGTLPFTFQKAAVTDEGYAVGYGNTGWDWSSREFVVAVVAPDGAVILEERTRNLGSLGPDRDERPHPLGLFVDPGGKWFVVRVKDLEEKLGELWWRYPIGSSGPREVIVPVRSMKTDPRLRYRILDVRVLPGTPWILIHWWRTEPDRDYLRPSLQGAAFTLVDAAGTMKWKLELPDDYRVAGDDAATRRIRRQVDPIGGILEVAPGGRFTLWHVQDGMRVTYQVAIDAPSAEECSVTEVSQERLDPEEEE